MELSDFLRQEIENFTEDLYEQNKKVQQMRPEESGVYSIQNDYEKEIKKAMTEGNVGRAKQALKKLITEAETKEGEESKRYMKLLTAVTDLIKLEIKEYNQELLIKPELDRYNKLIEKYRSIPEEITGINSNISFFNEKEAAELKEKNEKKEEGKTTINLTVNPTITGYNSNMLPENQLLSKPQPVHKEKQQIEEKVIPDIPQSMPSNIQPKYGGPTRPLPIIHAEISQNANQLIQKFRELEKELNNALITEDLDKSKRVYAIMKEIFSKFPDEFYDVKTDLFSDILSANFRVHQLEEAMNEMEKRELDRILIDQERQEEIIEEKKKIRIEKEKIKEEIEKVQEDISSIDLKNRIVTHSKDDIIIEEKDVDKLKELARLERWKHDRNKLEREPHVKEENRHFLPKPTLKHHIRHIEQNETRSEINEKIIKQLYQKGLINLYSNNKDEAKDYFNRILEINPFHKPSIIRLEQLT